jgi:opacity protein-like surface antigen
LSVTSLTELIYQKELFMKKKIIYSSALAALLSASSIALAGGPEILPIEDYFSGFYVGGTGALHHADFESSSTVVLTDPIVLGGGLITTIISPQTLSYQELNGKSLDGYGGVQGGFGWTFNHVWYLGIQGFGEWGSNIDNTSTQKTLARFDAFYGTVTDVATATQNINVKLAGNGGVAAKFGYVVEPRTLVYGKVGASWAKLTVSNTAVISNDFDVSILGIPLVNVNTTISQFPNTNNTDEETKVGLLLGIGFEHFIWEDILSVNFEYDYVNYGTVDTGQSQLTGGSTLSVFGIPTPIPVGSVAPPIFTSSNTSVAVNSFLGGLNFYFGRDWFI